MLNEKFNWVLKNTEKVFMCRVRIAGLNGFLGFSSCCVLFKCNSNKKLFLNVNREVEC